MTQQDQINLLLEIIAEIRQSNMNYPNTVNEYKRLLEEEKKRVAYLESTLVHPNRIDEKNQEIEALKRRIAALESQIAEKPAGQTAKKNNVGNKKPRTEAQLRALAESRERRHQEKLARESAKETAKEEGADESPVFLAIEGNVKRYDGISPAARHLSKHLRVSREEARAILADCIKQGFGNFWHGDNSFDILPVQE